MNPAPDGPLNKSFHLELGRRPLSANRQAIVVRISDLAIYVPDHRPYPAGSCDWNAVLHPVKPVFVGASRRAG